MGWIMIFFIWMAAPFAELIIIIALAIVNSKRKTQNNEWLRQIRRLNGELEEMKKSRTSETLQKREAVKKQEEGERTEPAEKLEMTGSAESAGIAEKMEGAETEKGAEPAETVQTIAVAKETKTAEVTNFEQTPLNIDSTKKAESAVTGIHEKVQTEIHEKVQMEIHEERQTGIQAGGKVRGGKSVIQQAAGRAGKFLISAVSPGLYQGMAALIIGVVFVVLSGLIFATTAWHVLPNICKAAGVLGFAALFFGASIIAGRVLKIRKTSGAFYILGSIFLFLSVLAVGYFGFLGPEFMLMGENRYRVLFVGSVVTDFALFCGYGKFQDRIYTQACLWGTTVSATFLMGSLRLGYPGCINGMIGYAGLLTVAQCLYTRRNPADVTPSKRQDAVMPAKEQAAGISLTEQTAANPSWRLADVFGAFADRQFWFFGIFAVFHICVGFLESYARIIIGQDVFQTFRVTFWSALAIVFMTLGLTFLSLKKDGGLRRELHAAACAVVFHYGVLWLPLEGVYQLMIAAVFCGGYFLAGCKWDHPLRSRAGDSILTLFLSADTVFLVWIALFSRIGIGEQAAASAAVILLGAAVGQWSRRNPALRKGIPYILVFLAVTLRTICVRTLVFKPEPDLAIGLYILAAAVWDVRKKDRFCQAILVIGTAAQVLFWISDPDSFPIVLLLGVYLFVKKEQVEEGKKPMFAKGGCLYLMAGAYLLSGNWMGNGVLRMSLVLLVYVAEYLLVKYPAAQRNGRMEDWLRPDRFWDVTGLALFLLTMRQFYHGTDLAMWNVIPCLISFAVLYVIFYLGGRPWPHLAAVLAILPLPFFLEIQYALTENQLYAGVAAAALITGIPMRRYHALWEYTGRERDRKAAVLRIDWYHILLVCVLIPMASFGNETWFCLYQILLALYLLQYAQIPVMPLRQISFTAAGLLLLKAYWVQPFIIWPPVVELELYLLPVALFIRLITAIWGKGRKTRCLQTTLYLLCLAALIPDAVFSGNVTDALILEAVCLLIFIGSHRKKSELWLRISGTVIVTMALYMTRSFWFSISWWVYLLAAGLGLILFAALNEMKKN